MAKLSARGRKEIARVSRESIVSDSVFVTWRRVTRALMSDNTILEKLDVRFAPTQYHPDGELHSYGWKVAGKLKADIDPAKLLEKYIAAGYKHVK